jgi:EmrB/QacA subfamily drug resistance transporter
MTTITALPPRARAAPSRRPALILSLLAFAQLIIALDYNIVYVALPDMASGLGFSEQSLQWVVSAYAVAFGGFLLLGGRACDLVQRRQVLLAGLALYAGASLVGGLAVEPWMLLVARAVQGLGGALLFPATLSLLNTTFAEGPERNRALSVWGAAGAGGMIVGSLAGGVLTQSFGWRAVFFVNVPLAALAIGAALRLLDATEQPRAARSFDLLGALTATVGTTLAVFALVQGPEAGWLSPGVVAPAAVGVGLLVAFAVIESRTAEPLVPLRLLADRDLGTGVVVTFLFMATMGTVLYFLTVYFQQVHHYSALRTGMAFLIPMAATCLGSMVAGRIATRLGNRATLIASLGVAAIGAVLVAIPVAPDGSYAMLLPGLVVFGLGQGTTYTLMFAAATAGVGAEDQGVASGMASTTQQVGGAVGLAILIGVASSGTGAATGEALSIAVTDGLQTALLAVAAGIVLTLLAALRFRRAPALPRGPLPDRGSPHTS